MTYFLVSQKRASIQNVYFLNGTCHFYNGDKSKSIDQVLKFGRIEGYCGYGLKYPDKKHSIMPDFMMVA